MLRKDDNKENEHEAKSYRSVTRGLNSTGSAVAAASASLINTLISYPLDLIKSRFQVQDGTLTQLPKYKGTLHALRDIYRTEGFRSLYTGATVGMLGAAVAWSSYMYAYNYLKDEMEQRGHRLTNDKIALASFMGGVGTMIITNPFWVIKTRLQVRVKGNSEAYKGVSDVVTRMYREEGFRSFYKGLFLSLVSAYHGSVQFVAYESFSTILLSVTGHTDLKGWIPFLAGGSSKILAQVTTHPLGVVRARLQNESAVRMEDRVHKNTWDVAVRIMKNEGFLGFYKGFAPSMWRLALNSALFFGLFEHIKLGLGYFSAFRK